MRTVIENIRTGARWSSVNGDVWRKDWNGTGDNYVQAGAVCPRFNPFSKRNAGKFRKVVYHAGLLCTRYGAPNRLPRWE